MNKLIIIFIILFGIMFASVVSAESVKPAEIYISEIQTESVDSKSEEFVEIKYTGFEDSTLKIYYQPISSDSWYKKAETELSAGLGRILFSNYLEDSQAFSGGLSSSGGRLKLVLNGNDTEMVEWSESVTAVGGQTLKRVLDEDGETVDCLDCSLLFVSDSPSPENNFIVVETTQPEPEEGDTPAETIPEEVIGSPEQPSEDPKEEFLPQTSNAKPGEIIISEVFADPAAPQTDSEDEFVELLNVSGRTISLEGISLLTGSKSNVVQKLGGQLAPGGYLVIVANGANISLVNDGMTVALLSQNTLLDNVEYPKAVTGMSYQLVDGRWDWALPTPASANQRAADDSEESGEILAESSNSNLSFGVVNPAAESPVNLANFATDLSSQPKQSDYLVLASVGAFTVFYLVYEYRVELADKIRKLKQNAGNSALFGAGLNRWRSNRVYQRCRRWQDDLRARLGRWRR